MQSGRHSQALATKVVPPRCVGLIERPRLLGLVTQVQAKRLTVIKAPAGFGKTSLAVAWADRLEKSRNSVAWFSIDADDDEPHLGQFVNSKGDEEDRQQRERDNLVEEQHEAEEE